MTPMGEYHVANGTEFNVWSIRSKELFGFMSKSFESGFADG